MDTAHITVDPRFAVAPVSRRTFGSFVEHLGRCVYTGIFEPDHPTAGADGFRADVLDMVRELGVSTVRYPGGNFVSGYRWEDGVGPVQERPARLDLAWHTLEPNIVGVDEFLAWCAAAGVEPMMAVNLGTRGPAEAVDLLDYCNGTTASALAEQRRRNGHPDPYRVSMWCLGNEMDGPWQIGHKTASEYGRAAAETARAMRMVQPDLELVACGSSGPLMPTFGDWEREVLSETHDLVDYISIHRYYGEEDGDLTSFLASAADMDRFIDTVVATIDHVRGARRSSRRIDLSFDEWNVWYQGRAESRLPEGDDWPVGPALLEDVYTAADAVVVGDMLICLLRHSDRVTSATQAQLVNVIAPIMTEPGGRAWRQTTFHPFALTSRHARGTVLRTEITSPRHATALHGEVDALSAVTTWDAESGTGALFVVNRSPQDALPLEVPLDGFGDVQVQEVLTLCEDDPYATNSADQPERVVPRPLTGWSATDGTLTVELPAVSWSVVRFSRAA